ncbi:LysR family transcriptional regulator [Xanthobacter sp. TB0139]|uniref:LysR family transcriptional regulator n=1 Tax=Xanthobacter sp. TB0139 TaxID=3459178 RepID=UPI00403A558C
MKRINPDLNDLRVFVTLAEAGGFRAAGEIIGLSSPALSRQIAQLEGRLNTRLFDRDTRNVELTPSGRELLGLARRVLNEAEKARGEFETFLAARRGSISMACLPSVTAGLMPPILSRFVKDRPDIDVRFLDAVWDGGASAVLDGRADLGLTTNTADSSGRLTFRNLIDDPIYAVAAPGGPLDEPRSFLWEEILAMPFVTMAPGTTVRDHIEASVTQIGAVFRPRFEVSHLASVGALVRQGLGVTALPRLTLPVIGGSSLIVRPLKAPAMVRHIGLLHLTGRSLSPAAQALTDVIVDYCRSYTQDDLLNALDPA